jgi:hypothetical protein
LPGSAHSRITLGEGESGNDPAVGTREAQKMSEKISVVQGVDESDRIVYRARGASAPDIATLAKSLGVSEGQCVVSVDPELVRRERRAKEEREINSPEGREAHGIDFDLHTGEPRKPR